MVLFYLGISKIPRVRKTSLSNRFVRNDNELMRNKSSPEGMKTWTKIIQSCLLVMHDHEHSRLGKHYTVASNKMILSHDLGRVET